MSINAINFFNPDAPGSNFLATLPMKFKELGPIIAKYATEAWESIKKIATIAVKAIVNFAKAIASKISKGFTRLWSNIKEAGAHVWIAVAVIAIAIVIGAVVTITVLTIKKAIKERQVAQELANSNDLLEVLLEDKDPPAKGSSSRI